MTDVATEREGRARDAFEDTEFPGDEGGGVAAADVGDGGDYGVEEYVGEVVNGCGRH